MATEYTAAFITEYRVVSTSKRNRQALYSTRFIIRLTLPTLKSCRHFTKITPTISIPPPEEPMRSNNPTPAPQRIPPMTQLSIVSVTIRVTGITDMPTDITVTHTKVLNRNFFPILRYPITKIGILII